MPKNRNLSLEMRAVINDRHVNGQSLTSLADEFKVSRSTVARICNKMRKTVHDLKRCGRPKVTSPREDRLLYRMQRQNPRASSKQIHMDNLASSGISLSTATIRNRMLSFGLKCRFAVKKCLISKVNKRKRYLWAKEHKNWTAENFSKVVWSDETPIHLLQTSQRRMLRCFQNEIFFPGMIRHTGQQGGGHVLFWGAFQENKVGTLVDVVESLNGQKYLDILKKNVKVGEMVLNGTIFQQDNAPSHKCKSVQNWLSESNIKVMNCPPQSPDLNPIKNVWSFIKILLDKFKVTSKKMLMEKLKDIWSKIPPSYLEKFVYSLPNRVQVVLKNKGGHTKY